MNGIEQGTSAEVVITITSGSIISRVKETDWMTFWPRLSSKQFGEKQPCLMVRSKHKLFIDAQDGSIIWSWVIKMHVKHARIAINKSAETLASGIKLNERVYFRF